LAALPRAGLERSAAHFQKPIIDMFSRIIQQLRVTDERYVTAVVHKEKMMLVGEMANTIIHDLRSPCQSVSMASC